LRALSSPLTNVVNRRLGFWLQSRARGIVSGLDMSTSPKFLLAAALVMLASAFPAPAGSEVRVHGATTVAYGLLTPEQRRIEKLSGVELSILPSSTSHGLADLVQGKADIAMLAEPLESIAASMNDKRPGFIDVTQFTSAHVGNAYVQVIVHPSNPVERLTNKQLAGLFSGRTSNWLEVSGVDQPVLLVGEPTSTPHRLIKEALHIDYAPDLRVVQNTNQTAIVVAQAPSAISYISTAHDLPVRNKLKVVHTDLRLPLALHLAFRKDAPARVKRVVDAAAIVGEQ
jgi:phosphate transport system substrate-binding protein